MVTLLFWIIFSSGSLLSLYVLFILFTEPQAKKKKKEAPEGAAVTDDVKEQKIANLHIGLNRMSGIFQVRCTMRHVQPSGQITVLHQAAAVEARRAVAFVLVGPADHGQCGASGLLADGCVDMFGYLTYCCGDTVGLLACCCGDMVGFLADIGGIAKWRHSGYRGASGENADSKQQNGEIKE